MQNYADDSELAKILTEANRVMSGISGRSEMDSNEMMELARRIADSTSTYAGEGANPATHFVERSARKVKSKIGMHIDMLKSTASNISQIKERIKGPHAQKAALPEVHIQANPGSNQLSDYNRKIDDTLKHLSTRTSGKTQIEEKIKRYRNIMGDVEGALKELPKNMKEGKVKKGKALDQKLIEKVDHKAEEMSRKIHDINNREKFAWTMEGYSSDDDDEEVGDWINYEGFNNKEDLDKFNEIFKEYVGEYPKEYEKRNQEEGYYDKDGMGRMIDTTKPGRPRRKGLIPPRDNKEQTRADALKRSEEIEKSLRDVLSRAKNGGGDVEVGSVASERKFLEDYIEKKMDTIHTGDGFLVKEEKEKKKNSERMARIKQKTEDQEDTMCLDGPSRKGPVAEDVPKSPARPSRKAGHTSLSFNTSSEKKLDVIRPKTTDENKELEEHIIWDMDRIKKLIVKERQEQLRKKREAWERNNELSEEILDREKINALKKTFHRPSGPFDAPVPNPKPSPSDFLTDRERHERMYRKATKGKEGVFHKEDLDYEFGVNSFYYDLPKNKKEGGDSKDDPISIRGYRGVRKKTEI